MFELKIWYCRSLHTAAVPPDPSNLWKYFHNSGKKQNSSHYIAYCKACVAHHQELLETAAAAANDVTFNASTEMLASNWRFEKGVS